MEIVVVPAVAELLLVEDADEDEAEDEARVVLMGDPVHPAPAAAAPLA